jgi:HAD superfamily phosphoserine phosphatase-like hydrolase
MKQERVRRGEETALINGYKLFYYRRRRGLSHTQLAKASRTNRSLLHSLETVRSPSAAGKHGHVFRSCARDVIDRIEKTLACPGQLLAGREDDLLSMYIQYYHCNRGKAPVRDTHRDGAQALQLFPVKCVIFDFDGTLTVQKDRTTWEAIWEKLGYTVEDCARLHRDFTNGVIDHQEWCERTCEAFNRCGISERILATVAADIKLMPGVAECLELLQDKGIEMHILSGSIEQIIHHVLGALASKITHIQANSFKFAGKVLSYIQGTDFDFEGKAAYVANLMQLKGLAQTDILFVGNSSNDRWVSRSGVTTLCVNPHFTDGNDEKEWLYCIREMHDFREILKFVRLPDEAND